MTILEYYLEKNNLKDVKHYRASVKPNGVVELEQVINNMCIRSGKRCKGDILATMLLFIEEIEDITLSGKILNLPFMKTNFSIQGKFDTGNDVFNPLKHHLKVNATIGNKLKNLNLDFSMNKTSLKLPSTTISVFVNEITKEKNCTVSPNAPASISGSNIAIDTNRDDNGVFFTNIETEEVQQVSNYIVNTNTQLIFCTPNLSEGKWRVSITTSLISYTGSGKQSITVLKKDLIKI